MTNDPNGFKFNDPVRIYEGDKFIVGYIEHEELGMALVRFPELMSEDLIPVGRLGDMELGYEDGFGHFWKINIDNIGNL